MAEAFFSSVSSPHLFLDLASDSFATEKYGRRMVTAVHYWVDLDWGGCGSHEGQGCGVEHSEGGG